MVERPNVLVTLNPSASLEDAIRLSPSIKKLNENGIDAEVVTIHDNKRERKRKFAKTNGLLLPGGIDIHPSFYGQLPHPALGQTNPAFDEMQIEIVTSSIEEGRPVLAICRGAQMLAVATEGSLHQNIRDITNEDHGPSTEVAGESSIHDIIIFPQTKAHALFDTDILKDVPSRHHQSIDNPGAFSIAGTSPAGIVEIIEHPKLPFVMGIQPHAELIKSTDHNYQTMQSIFENFYQETFVQRRANKKAS